MSTDRSPCDVLVTSCRTRIGYNIVRSLARAGLKVAVGIDAASGMARYSRYAGAVFRHPDPYSRPEDFVDSVAEMVASRGVGVVMPSGEECFILARHRERVESAGASLPVDSFETLTRLNDKHWVGKRASELGIPVPRQLQPADWEAVRRFCREAPGGVYLKFRQASGAEGVFLLPEKEPEKEARRLLDHHEVPIQDVIVQQAVSGDGFGVSMLCREGEVLTAFGHRRLREKFVEGGPSTARISAREPRLFEWAERLLASVAYTGVAMVEFKGTEEDRYLLEVNPRFWGSLGLAIRCGADFPVFLYQLAVAEREGDYGDYPDGVCVKWLLGDAYARFAGRRRGPRSGRLPRARAWDDLYLDDPVPFVAQILIAFRRARQARRSPEAGRTGAKAW